MPNISSIFLSSLFAKDQIFDEKWNGVFVCMCVYACVRFQNGDSFIRENGEIFWLPTLAIAFAKKKNWKEEEEHITIYKQNQHANWTQNSRLYIVNRAAFNLDVERERKWRHFGRISYDFFF